jgi:hypothetical protein
MQSFKAMSRRIGGIGLAFAALVSIAAMAGPAAAYDWNHRHYRHHDGGSFSFGFSSPGYYYAPPPGYYAPGPSFNLVVPFGSHH